VIDPALLTSLGDDLYEVRAFPVPAGEERSVSFTVTSPAVASDGQVLLEIPWARMSPRPDAAAVEIEVEVPWEVRSVLAPGFELDVERDVAGDGSGELSASWESGSGWTAASSFRTYLNGGDGLIDTRVLTYRDPSADGYFALLFAPVLEVDAAVARDVVLVLDTSGSMEGEKLEQAQDAAAYVLERLGPDDRFAVVSFARSVEVYGDRMHAASRADDAIEHVRELDAGGGTNIAGSLEAAFELLDGERPSTVIFLTDGLPTVGIDDAEGILEVAREAAPARAQLFAFGVGYDVDTVLLDALATRFVGTSHYVTPEERIDLEVGRLYERVSTPVLTDVEIEIDGVPVRALAPEALGGLFAGQQALLTGRYEEAGTMEVVVTGNSFEGAERFEYEVSLPSRDTREPAVAQLWAQRRVADLLTEVRIEGPRDSLIEEIVELATQFGIVTPYTAYLAEEPELALDAGFAFDEVQARSAAAPSSGEAAVDGASDLEALRAGSFSGGGAPTVRQLGAHSYYLIDGAWVRDGYESTSDVTPVLVGSAEFAAAVEAEPAVAAAAALGSRVITLAADGSWLELSWPGEDSGSPVTFELPNRGSGAAPVDAVVVSDPVAGASGTEERAPSEGGRSFGAASGGGGASVGVEWALVLGGAAALAAGGVLVARRRVA
jgi:Ca-activated chloride channel family protein